MSKEYYSITTHRTARPRSKRLRELGLTGLTGAIIRSSVAISAPSESGSTGPSIWVLKENEDGSVYAYCPYAAVSQYDITAFASQDGADYSNLYSGLPIDPNTLEWVDGVLTVIGAATKPSELDVIVTDPQQGQTLVYDAEQQKWVNGSAGTGTVKSIQFGTGENVTTYNPDESGTIVLPDYPAIPETLKNPEALTVNLYGTAWGSYDGSEAKTLDIANPTWEQVTDKPTTLSGYGITDAKISGGVITLGSNTITPLTAHQKLYALTLQLNGSTVGTYTPNSAAQTLNISAYSKTDSDAKYVTALGTSSNYLTWTKGGTTNNITVPYATDADTLDGIQGYKYMPLQTFGVNMADYTTYYVGLIRLDSGSGSHEWATGEFVFTRINGVTSPVLFRYLIQKKYNTTIPFVLADGELSGVTFCTFTHTDGYKWAGFKIYKAAANFYQGNYFTYYGTQTPFITSSVSDLNTDENQYLPQYVLGGLYVNESPVLTSDNYTTYVTKIGTSTVGGTAQPVYLNAGVPTACTAYSGLLTAFSNSGNGLSITVGGTTKSIGSLAAQSAEQLATARTLWGQSFNGTANVTGSLSGVTDITMSGTLSIGGITVKKHTDGYLYIDGDLVVSGEVVAFGGSFSGSTIMDAIAVDGTTITKENGVLTVIGGTGGGLDSVTVTGSGNAVTAASLTDNKLTLTKGATFLTAHQAVSNKAAALSWGTTSTLATVGSTNITVTMPSNPNTDTKNTAGSTDTSSKLYLIGATSQAENPQTYSHDTAYIGTDGCLYSGGAKVLTAHQTLYALTLQLNGSTVGTYTPNSAAQTLNISAYSKTDSDAKYITALGTSGNYLTWTKGGTTNNITVPYATDADTLDGVEYQNILERKYSGNKVMSASGWYRIAESLNTEKLGLSCILLLKRNYYSGMNEAYAFAITVIYHGKTCITQLSGTAGVQYIPKIRVTGPGSGTYYIDFYYSKTSSNTIYWTTIGDFKSYTSATSDVSESTYTTEFSTISAGAGSTGILYSENTKVATVTNLTDGSVTKIGTSTVGGTAQPVYLNAGVPTACTAYSGLLTAFSNSGNGLSITVGGTTKSIGSLAAQSAAQLATARTLWGQSFNGTANVTGSLSGVTDITMSGTLSIGGITVKKHTDGYLYIDGDLVVSSDVVAFSDRRLKQNIATLEDRGDLRPVEFDKEGRHEVGFIAQEVQTLYPELVHDFGGDEHYLGLNYPQLTAVLAAQIISLKQRIKQLEEKLNS